MYVFDRVGLYRTRFSFLECLSFGAMTSAVDSAAVLSLFDEIGVHEMMYMLAIGESVFNDSVAIEFYSVLRRMIDSGVSRSPVMNLIISMGQLTYACSIELLIGFFVGLFGSITTRFTVQIPLFEPLIVLLFCFTAYSLGATATNGGVISLLICAIFMNRYVECNVSKKSHNVLKYCLKIMGSIAEDLIFTFMGIYIILHTHVWDIGFICMTLISIFLLRFIVTFLVSLVHHLITRTMSTSTTSLKEQCILSYSGLRSISFVLAMLIPSASLEKKDMLITTTIVICCVSIFVQGVSIRPLISLILKKDILSAKKISEGLQEEGLKLKIEEQEVENALTHTLYLESTCYKGMDVYNMERVEFEEVNTMVEERIMWKLLDEIEDLNGEFTAFNVDYINSEGLARLVEEKKFMFEDIQSAWSDHLNRLGLERSNEASSEIAVTLKQLREYTRTNANHNHNHLFSKSSLDVELGEIRVHGIPVPSIYESNFLFFLLEKHGIIQKHPRDENFYVISCWAQDEGLLYYIQRLLQEENIHYWISQVNEFLNERKFFKVIPLLRVLRYEIRRQQEIRISETAHLRKIDFAYNVFSIGVDHAMDAVRNIVGRRVTMLGQVDRILQKLCLRNLRNEEISLLNALNSMMKFEGRFVALNSMQVEQEDSDRLMKEIEEQQRAMRLIQQSTMDDSVNYMRIMADTDTSIFKASKEYDSLLRLEQQKITGEEFMRLKNEPDLPNIPLTTTGGVEHKERVTPPMDHHDEWVHQIRRASLQYEKDLADYEEFFAASSSGSRDERARRQSASWRSNDVTPATTGSRVNESPLIRSPLRKRRHSWVSPGYHSRRNSPSLTPKRASSPLNEISTLELFTFPSRSIDLRDIPEHKEIEDVIDAIPDIVPAPVSPNMPDMPQQE